MLVASMMPRRSHHEKLYNKGEEAPSSSPVVQGSSKDTARSFASTYTDTVTDTETAQPHETPSHKRPLDAPVDPVPTKRARLESDELAVPSAPSSTPLHQPTPRRAYASFLQDFVDPSPVPSSRLGPGTVCTFVSEWLKSLDSEKAKRSRSDSFLLCCSEDDKCSAFPKPSRSTTSDMAYDKDDDGFVIPTPSASGQGRASTLASAQTGAGGSTSYGTSYGRLVEDPLYRDVNLAANSIFLRDRYDPLPEHAANLVAGMGKKRDSPEPSPDDLSKNCDWRELWNGRSEKQVINFFKGNVPTQQQDPKVMVSDDQEMLMAHVPATYSASRVSTPKPDLLYGYNRNIAFDQQQRMQLLPMQRAPLANTSGLLYPFFAIEFKGDGPASNGNMWVATNQCMGDSATCVNIAERLNADLRQCRRPEVRPVDSSAFSIAMDGIEAQLFVSWKADDLNYYVGHVRGFLLQEPDHYLAFRRHVRNIIDWGKDKRLKEIQRALDNLLEEGRLRASEAARERAPPETDDSRTSEAEVNSSIFLF